MHKRKRERFESRPGRQLIDAYREESAMFYREGRHTKARRYRAVADRMALAQSWGRKDELQAQAVSPANPVLDVYAVSVARQHERAQADT